jgi:glycosyltransferase involved in cell wall biosynthesis
MKIGFDAKRAFHNTTGLGNYSRTLIEGLALYYPQHQYYLFNPKASRIYTPAYESIHEVNPVGLVDKKLSSLWRSSRVKTDLQKSGIQLYHGLSNEIPVGIQKTGIPSVVTIHDLIFERFPSQFNKIDVGIYKRKYRYACEHADRIIAISQQTKQDLVDLYKIEAGKIDVCYQSCDPVFSMELGKEKLEAVRNSFELPERFFLYVGSVIERKNLLTICRAMEILKGRLDLPLVVVGKGKTYKEEVQAFIRKNDLEERVIFLSDEYDSALKEMETLAAIYQLSTAFIYPSSYEGFGIPVLEALWSRTPVITSNASCLPEVGGDAALYIDPLNAEQLAVAMENLVRDEGLRKDLIGKGLVQAGKFGLKNCTDGVMKVYNKILSHAN